MVLYCLLPQIHSTDKPEELQKKAPSTVTNFFQNCHLHIVFSYSAIIIQEIFFIYVFLPILICACFFTDAIISYSIQKSIVWIVNIYTLFPVFLYIFYIFPDYFRLYFNDLIFITDIFFVLPYLFFKIVLILKHMTQ